jgi:hypothetical protein
VASLLQIKKEHTMTRDFIILLAEEWGILEFENNESQVDNILHFAASVAAVEREACAKMCDSEVEKLTQWHPREAMAVGVCAAAIRARGDK